MMLNILTLALLLLSQPEPVEWPEARPVLVQHI